MVMALKGYREDEVRGILEDVEGSTLIDSNQKAMLHFAEELTRLDKKLTQSDIGILRNNGFSDEEILEAVLVIGFYNLMNRFVIAIGSPVEEVRELFFQQR